MTKLSPEHITAAQVRAVLDYDPETGVLRWRKGRGGQAAGSEAGCVASNGYRYVYLFGRGYLAHRLAWLIVHGSWPDTRLDHRDRNTENNRIGNLRKATSSQNAMNSATPSTNTSGHRGVCRARGSKWRAYVGKDGRQHGAGTHNTIEAAVAARDALALKLHGNFARTTCS